MRFKNAAELPLNRRLLHVSAFVAIAAGIGGCAVGRYGTLVTTVEQHEGAYGVTIYALGAYVRTQPGDAGWSLGYTKRSYFFAGEPLEDKDVYWWRVPADLPMAVGNDTSVVGVDVDLSDSNTGIVVGYQSHQLYTQAALNSSMCIKYETDLDGNRTIIYMEGGNECPFF
jgi:hypothetical protein